MQSRSLAFFFLVILLIASIAVGLWTAQSLENPTAAGEVGQSPLLYILLVLLIAAIGFLLHKVLNGENSRFSFWGFINVAAAAMLISGLAHELTHVLLITHPTQLRVHFGDSNAIFSTCCLLPGENPYEMVAYGIQFLVMIVWLFFNRRTFYNGRFRNLWKSVSEVSQEAKPFRGKSIPKEKNNSKSKKQSRSSSQSEDSLEKEWRQHRTTMVEGLSPNRKRSRRMNEDLEEDISRINRLKV